MDRPTNEPVLAYQSGKARSPVVQVDSPAGARRTPLLVKIVGVGLLLVFAGLAFATFSRTRKAAVPFGESVGTATAAAPTALTISDEPNSARSVDVTSVVLRITNRGDRNVTVTGCSINGKPWNFVSNAAPRDRRRLVDANAPLPVVLSPGQSLALLARADDAGFEEEMKQVRVAFEDGAVVFDVYDSTRVSWLRHLQAGTPR